MLLLENYNITRLGYHNFKIEMLFKDDNSNIQIKRVIENIRFDKSGIYYMYYNQYLNKYEVKDTINLNVYHFINILELNVDLENGSLILKDCRKEQNNNQIIEESNNPEDIIEKDNNETEEIKQIQNIQDIKFDLTESKNIRNKRKKNNTE